MSKSKKIFSLMMILMLVLTFALESEARKRKRHSRKVHRQTSVAKSNDAYPSKPHNPDFLNSCTTTLPTVYNPSIENVMEGGKKNRMNTFVNSVDDVVLNGYPVTVAMDMFGEFGAKCNYSEPEMVAGEKVRVTKRCLMLVQLPGLDDAFPQYAQKFQKLPPNTFLALVEDTGGAFYNKGTGKMDIPFRIPGWQDASPFVDTDTHIPHDAKFEVIRPEVTNGNAIREVDYSAREISSITGKQLKCVNQYATREMYSKTAGLRAPTGQSGVN